MALQNSGAISLNDIHVEAGGSSGTSASINDADIRDLIGKSSGATSSFSEFYGASSSLFSGPTVTAGTLLYAENPITSNASSSAVPMVQMGDHSGATLGMQDTTYARDNNTTAERDAFRGAFGNWTSTTNNKVDYCHSATVLFGPTSTGAQSDEFAVELRYLPDNLTYIGPGGSSQTTQTPPIYLHTGYGSGGPPKGWSTAKVTVTGKTSGATRVITAPASKFTVFNGATAWWVSWAWRPATGYFLNTSNPEVSGSGTFVNEQYTLQLVLS